MSDRTELIARLAPGYVECQYADAEWGNDAWRKAISKSGFKETVEVGLFLPDPPGVKFAPAIWLCREQVARDLAAVRGSTDADLERKARKFFDLVEIGAVADGFPLKNVVDFARSVIKKDPT